MIRYSPCYECKERKNNCHSGCGKYAEYRNQIDNLNLQRRNEKEESYVRKYLLMANGRRYKT